MNKTVDRTTNKTTFTPLAPDDVQNGDDIAERGKYRIQRGSGHGPLLFPESFDVDAAVVVESGYEVQASHHPDRNAIADLDGDLGSSHTLAGQGWHRMVQ